MDKTNVKIKIIAYIISFDWKKTIAHKEKKMNVNVNGDRYRKNLVVKFNQPKVKTT